MFDCIKRVYSTGNMIKDNPNSKIKEPITIKYIFDYILALITLLIIVPFIGAIEIHIIGLILWFYTACQALLIYLFELFII